LALLLSFYEYTACRRLLHSFPTRRSSDLFSNPIVEHLLTEVQSPVEGRAVVVNQLGVGHNFADAVDHASDLTNVGLLGFDPQQVDRKSTRLNSSHVKISYAVFCLKKKST